MSLNLVIDLDGTLAHWETGTGDDGGGPGGGFGVGEWIDGAKEAVRAWVEEGHLVIVHSCRATWVEGGGWTAIARFLVSGGFLPNLVDQNTELNQRWMHPLSFEEHGFTTEEVRQIQAINEDAPIVGVWMGKGKPRGHYYIDDRAIEFTGDWQAVRDRIEQRHELWRRPT